MKLKLNQKLTTVGSDSDQQLKLKNKRRTREIFIFFLCLLMSFFLWNIQNLQQTITLDVDIPLHYEKIPASLSPDCDTLPPSVSIRLKGRGVSLLKYKFFYKFKPFNIPVTHNHNNLASYQFPNQDIQAKLDAEFTANSNLSIVRMQPASFSISLMPKKQKEVKIEPKIKLNPSGGFVIVQSKIEPDVISIFGNDNTLKRVKSILTQPLVLNNLTKDVKKEIQLQLPQGVTSDVKKVKLTVKVDYLCAVALGEQPIQPLIFPNGEVMRLLPSQVKVELNVPQSKLNEAKNYQIQLSVPNQNLTDLLGNGHNGTLPVIIQNKPDWIKGYKISPEVVEFIIENNNTGLK